MASLVFISHEDLLMDFAKDHDLHNYNIMIASHEISGSLKTASSVSGISQAITYESKYDNIEFVNSLRPTPTIMEYAYSEDKTRFASMYASHLISDEPYLDLCTILDMVVNQGYNIMIVMARYEHAGRIPSCLREFIENEFGIVGYIYEDLLRLSENYGTPVYDKIVKTLPYKVPEEFTGRNFDVITSNFTGELSLDEIKQNLEVQKAIAVGMNTDSADDDSDFKSVFFNRFTEDLKDKVKESLMNKSEEIIKEICRNKQIRISPKYSKEFLVDKILLSMHIDNNRRVEYEYNE